MVQVTDEKTLLLRIKYKDSFLHFTKQTEQIIDFYLLFFITMIKQVLLLLNFDVQILFLRKDKETKNLEFTLTLEKVIIKKLVDYDN